VVFQVEVFWIVTPCSVVVGYQSFGGPCSQQIKLEVFWVVRPCNVVGYRFILKTGGSMDLRNVVILPQHYTASQLGRPRLEAPKTSSINPVPEMWF
jgi:hypothetical protein